MLLDRRSVGEAQFADVVDLVEDGVPEDTEIDYKRALPSWSQLPPHKLEEERNDFASDACAFANARGGWIVYGVKCRTNGDRGIPDEIVGIDESLDLDKEQLRLRDLVKSRTDPVVSIETRAISGDTPEGRRTVLVVRFEDSWNPPHMNIVQHVTYQRQGAHKVALDVEQMRRIILGSRMWRERLNLFLEERWQSIRDNERPDVPIPVGCVTRGEEGSVAPLPGLGRIAMHVTPTRSFEEDAFVDVVPLAKSRLDTIFSDEYDLGVTVRHSALLEGCVAIGPVASSVTSSYSLAFRNGVVESVDCQVFRPTPPMDGISLYPQEIESRQVIDSGLRDRLLFIARRHSELIEELGHPLPHGITVGFVQVGQWTLSGSRMSSGRFLRDDVRLPVLVFDDRNDSLEQALDNLFLGVWQAAGRDSAPPR